MILQCPECQARFMVADAQIPPQGRTVKCGRCAHQWHVALPPPPETAPAPDPDDWDPLSMAAEVTSPAPPLHDPENFAEHLAAADARAEPAVSSPEITPMPEDATAGVPSLPPWAISTKPLMIAAPLLAVLWLLLALVAHYDAWAHLPVLENIYTTVGITPTDGLAFEDLVMKREESDGKTNFILAGSIANQSAQARLVPTVRVKLLDATGKTLWSRHYIVRETLKGGDVYPFRITNVETTMGAAVASIQVDVGNSLQLMVRR